MPSEEKYSDSEAKKRFEAALRGARAAEPTPMKDIPPKRKKVPRKAKSPATKPGSRR